MLDKFRLVNWAEVERELGYMQSLPVFEQLTLA